jgi:nitroreductase
MSLSIESMSVRDAIYGRCSVRAYAPGKVDPTTLNALLDAAVRAPTAMHGEPWQFVVVQDADLLRRLSERAKAAVTAEAARLHLGHGGHDVFAQPGFNIFYDAGTLVIICARSVGRFEVADCWLAAQNMMLAAHAMGLGTCVIGSAVSVLNLADVKQELGMPPQATAVAPIIVGKPRAAGTPSARNPPQVIAAR